LILPSDATDMAYFAFLFVCLMWGSTFILLERVSHVLGPAEIGAFRLLSAAAALGVIWWFKRDVYRLERRDWGPILLSALVANVPPYISQPYVLAQGFGHSFFGVAVAAIPLLTILMSISMLGVWPTWRQLAGVVGGLFCLWFVIEDGIHRGMSLGLLALAAMVPITAAFNNTFIKRKLSHAQALPMTTAILGSAGLMLLPLVFCRPAIDALHLAGPAHPVFTPAIWFYLAALGVVATGLSTVAFFYMVLKQGPLFAGMTTYVVPLVAMAWGMFDHETISTQQLVAMAGVLVMVGVVQSSTTRPEELIELLPEAATDVAPAPLQLCNDDSLSAPATLVTTASDSACFSPPVTSA
jgi:drug/metabolite transporter (DMT)-like permease